MKRFFCTRCWQLDMVTHNNQVFFQTGCLSAFSILTFSPFTSTFHKDSTNVYKRKKLGELDFLIQIKWKEVSDFSPVKSYNTITLTR